MIATSTTYRTYGDDTTWTDTSASYCTPSRYYSTGCYIGYTVTSNNYSYKPLPLKELMKLWAKERMRVFWTNPIKEEPNKIVIIKPIPLRCVILNGHGWANQK